MSTAPLLCCKFIKCIKRAQMNVIIFIRDVKIEEVYLPLLTRKTCLKGRSVSRCGDCKSKLVRFIHYPEDLLTEATSSVFWFNETPVICEVKARTKVVKEDTSSIEQITWFSGGSANRKHVSFLVNVETPSELGLNFRWLQTELQTLIYCTISMDSPCSLPFIRSALSRAAHHQYLVSGALSIESEPLIVSGARHGETGVSEIDYIVEPAFHA